MKVKIGPHWFDSDEDPIMIRLTQQDKENISNMEKGISDYCCYPDNPFWTSDDFKNIIEWMSGELEDY